MIRSEVLYKNATANLTIIIQISHFSRFKSSNFSIFTKKKFKTYKRLLTRKLVVSRTEVDALMVSDKKTGFMLIWLRKVNQIRDRQQCSQS
jgi:hypothetical protein